MDAGARPTPSEMLQHPWIIEQQTKKVAMDKWVAQVWGWKRPAPSPSPLPSRRDLNKHEMRSQEYGQRDKTNLNSDPEHIDLSGPT